MHCTWSTSRLHRETRHPMKRTGDRSVAQVGTLCRVAAERDGSARLAGYGEHHVPSVAHAALHARVTQLSVRCEVSAPSITSCAFHPS
jgi:hypothetical protein